MSLFQILLPSLRSSAAVIGAFTLAGSGLWLAKSAFVCTVMAESPAAPRRAFSGFLGPSLPLEKSESVNHNTKRLRFKFPTSDTNSGLNLTSSVLTVSWPKGNWLPVLRPYTPVSALDEPGHIDLMVKHYPNGKASTYLHSLVQGESLFFLAALRGYPWSPNKYSHVTLIAGGAGITPMYQLIQGILRNPDDRTKITLVYGANTDEDLLFTKEFDEYEKRFSDRFNAVFVVTHPSKDSPFKKGYVSKALLEDAAGRPSEKKNTKVFICGPPAMEAALVGDQGFRPRSGSIGILAELGYSKDQIHKF